MTEVPVTLYKDGRDRPPHLRRWRDGWRHLRFMLLHAPNWLFIYPGLSIVFVASMIGILLLRGPIRIGVANLDVHSLLAMSFMVILGIQIIFTGCFAKVYAHLIGVLPSTTPFVLRLRKFSLEKLLVVAIIIGIVGMTIFADTFYYWYSAGFPDLDYKLTMRRIIPAFTLITVAGQAIFNGFMFSMLFLKTSRTVGENIYD